MGALAVLLSAVGFGLLAVFAKLSYDDGVQLDALLLVRFGLAGAMLALVAGATGRFRGLSRGAVVTALLMGAIGYNAQSGLYLSALTHLDASQVTLVFSLYPLLVMVVAVLTGRERASWRRGSVLNRVSEERADTSAALAKAARDARAAFGDQAQGQLDETLSIVAATAKELGISIGENIKAMLDAHSVSFSGGTISLHAEDGVPLRGLGIGSTRLLIAGLQPDTLADHPHANVIPM